MWIYLSHFRIWPPLDRNLPQGVAYTITILAGVAIWQLTVWLPALGRRVASSLAHLQEERAARRNRDREATPPRLRSAPGRWETGPITEWARPDL